MLKYYILSNPAEVRQEQLMVYTPGMGKLTVWEEFPELLEEEEVAEAGAQFSLAHYLVGLLRWRFRQQNYYAIGNMYIVSDNAPPIAPDAFMAEVVLSRAEQRAITSYDLREPNRPPPAIVFEISSKKTWKADVTEKITRYRDLGIREYFAYDPAEPRVWDDWLEEHRLLGWRYHNAQITYLYHNENGWLYSEVLGGWLMPDEENLWLVDADGNRVMTPEEELVIEREARTIAQEETARERQRAAEAFERANFEQLRADFEQFQADRERRKTKEAEQKAEQERIAREAIEQKMEQERIAREAIEQKVEQERLARKAAEARIEEGRRRLRELGLNPDDIL
jgi:Uma2 family endonuclease